MDSNEVVRATERASFSDLNGQIMRICNLLKPSIRTVNAVYSLCKQSENYKYTEQQIRQALNICAAPAISWSMIRGALPALLTMRPRADLDGQQLALQQRVCGC